MHPTVSQYAQALDELAEYAPDQMTVLVDNFFAFLKRRGEGDIAYDVLRRLEQMHDVAQKSVRVEVQTAQEVSSDEMRQLQEQAQVLFPEKQVVLHHSVDVASIGGALFQTEEMQYDMTLRASLDSLRTALLKTGTLSCDRGDNS